MSKSLSIAYLPGDGIGPEIGAIALDVLKTVADLYGHTLEITECAFGGAAIDKTGTPLPDETLQACQNTQATLLGAIGGPKWEGGDVRPEQGLLKLRKELETYANIRPVKAYPALYDKSPLKNEKLDGVDIVFVRELTGGIYFGEKGRKGDGAYDICSYSQGEIDRILRIAGTIAQKRDGKLTSVDKANVLETSRLWRARAEHIIGTEFPDVTLEHLYVDAAAMHLLTRPADFDVVVTENLFGDILSDEASVLPGSLGLLPSASMGDGDAAIYEPIHGSAPDIAGKGIANPMAMVLSAAMMLRHSFDLEEEAKLIEDAVAQAMDRQDCTPDLGGTLKTAEVGAALLRIIKDSAGDKTCAA